MHCTNCGTLNEVGSRFCFNCGAALAVPGGRAAPAVTSGVSQPPPVVVVSTQAQTRRQNWWPAILISLLLFGCALWTSLIEITPAVTNKLPEFMQGSAEALAEWQSHVVVPAPIQAVADVIKDLRDGMVMAMQSGATAGQIVDNGPPMISVPQATMCRKGPGSDYQAIGDLQAGETTEIVGQYAGGDWWVIENYGVSGTCWLYGGYAQIIGNTSSLPHYDTPSLPEAKEEEQQQPAGNITFTFNNLLQNEGVCEVKIRPASSGSWGPNLISSPIYPQSSASITIPDQGNPYNLKVLTCAGGEYTGEYMEYGVTITEGASYPFRPY